MSSQDQILAGLVADALGVSPRRVNYIAYSGGGESMSAILGGQVSAGINGLAEFAPQIEAGTVRVLGISSVERLPSLDAPTLREQGIDVVLENWRSLVAPPGIGAEQRTRLTSVIRAMVQSPAWRDILQRYRWNDRYLDGDAFAGFTASEAVRVRIILDTLGTGNAAGGSPGSVGAYPLLVLGSLAGIAAALGLRAVRSGGLAAEPAGAGWSALLVIGAGIVLDLVLLERAGFIIASSALFWLTARAFDATHPARDAAFALGLSVAVYLLFVLCAIAIGVARFRRDVWGTPSESPGAAAVARGLRDALTLRHLHSSGVACTTAEEVRTPWRRWFHHGTFYGFMLCFASTSVAAVYDALGWSAPYAYTSLAVVLGTAGGIGLLFGPAGLMVQRWRRDPALADPAQDGLDESFLSLLFLTSLSGLVLLVLRDRTVMGLLLIAHLGIVMALFLTLPYGKFVHGFYRLAALVKYHLDAERR